MAKIEELTELLVTEISNFEKSIQKLETLSEKINGTKIRMDVTEYKSIIESHQQKMASHTQTIERFEQHFDNQISQAKIYPTWAVIVFIMSVLVSMLSLFFALY